MFRVMVRFYEELNDFLPVCMRKHDNDLEFKERRSVKDFIESLGVPHVEVDLILVNGKPVDFSYIVNDGDRMSVYPVFERFAIGGVSPLRERPLRNPRFILDVHLRALARRLRLLGFDVDYSKERDDRELADISEKEKRILLSRDLQLMMRKKVSRGLYVRNIDPRLQVEEILDRLDLRSLCVPFSRCIECNGTIRPIGTGGEEFKSLYDRIPEGVRSWCLEYFLCESCGKIYWKGSHYDRLKDMVDRYLKTRSG